MREYSLLQINDDKNIHITGRNRQQRRRGILAAVLLPMLLLTLLTACGSKEEEPKSPVDGKKVAYIINMAHSSIFDSCAERCDTIAAKLGMDCDAFFSDGDDERFRQYVRDCAENGYDGLYLSHGGESYSYEFLTGLLKDYPELKLVTFDTQFKDNEGTTRKIDGVTQFFQDDRDLAEKLLEYICGELVPDQVPARILKVWVGNYLAPFERRNVGYQKYEEEGKIVTVETIGPEDYVDAVNSMYRVMRETLKKYSEEEIDAIWVAYDAYAQGAYRAVMESGKNIPLVSVDICSQDMAYMKQENSVWKACTCTDFKANGEQGIRILALELNGEYDRITDIKTGEATDYIEIPASLITADYLPTGTQTLDDVAPESYGAVSNYVTSDWLKEYIGY